MRHFPKWMLFLVLGMVMIATVSTQLFQSYRYNDITKTMNEATRIAITKSLNPSVRVMEGKVSITQSAFESNFKQQFQKTNIKLKVKSYKFAYLKTSDNYIKALKVKIIDDEDTAYQTTYIANVVK
ncbi:hypothetical protein [Heyndrickxia camelliae]|uniref:DUF4845 domain-containing protein n=1 Tax=Heyndrickxia camelliae TaxID=1707093 RepID=A0A2N3LEL8_9BACI|nr:hypothetical protein [Heyndrickxia camelliae]PKR83056.1 hypothetical protein CWO92_21200 [Heyndrickxia camelliae]